MTDDELQQLMEASDDSVPTGPDSSAMQPGTDSTSPGMDDWNAYPNSDTSGEATTQSTFMPSAVAAMPAAQPQTQTPAQTTAALPSQQDVLANLARQSIQSRLQASMQPVDNSGLQAAQQEGNWRGLISRGLTGLASIVGVPRGGKSDPVAYAQLLQNNNAQNFKQSNEMAEAAQNQPVQQYMQRQAQAQLGLQQQKAAGEDAIKDINAGRAMDNEQSLADYRRALIAQKTGQGTYTPEQVQAAQGRVKSLAKNYGVDLTDEDVANVTPGQPEKSFTDLLKTRSGQIARATESQNRAQAHMEELARKGASQAERAAASAALQQANGQVRLALAGIRNFATDARVGGQVAPGVASDGYANVGQVKDWSQMLNSSTTAIRMGREIQDLYKQGGGTGWALMAPSEREAKVGTLLAAIQPMAQTAEFKQAATAAHLGSIADQIGNPTAIRNLANDKYFPTKLGTMMDNLSKNLKTRAAATFSGGTLLQEPGDDIKPGLVKTAPAGRPGSARPQPPQMSQLPLNMPGQAPPSPGVTFLIKGTPTLVTDPTDVARARAAKLREVSSGQP